MTRSGEATRNEVAVSNEYFLEWDSSSSSSGGSDSSGGGGSSSSSQIIVDRTHLGFDFVGRGGVSCQTIRLTNNTNAKVSRRRRR